MINYFRGTELLMGRIFHHWEDPLARRRGVSWMGNKAVELSWTVGLEGTVVGGRDGGLWGPLPLFLPPFFPPLTKLTNNHWAASKPLADNNMSKKKPQLNRRGEKRKRVIQWPPLWECCKLCFPEALGIPHQSWNLRAWKTGPESPERWDFRKGTTSLVVGRWQWCTFCRLAEQRSK